MLYKFRITLKDQRTGKTVTVNIDSCAKDYLNAWKEACEMAWGELNDHDNYWFIESIKHCL